MAERVLRGRPGSPGLAIGPLVRLPKVSVDYVRPTIEQRGDTLLIREEVEPAVERDRLEAALERARQELAALAAGADGIGTEILEFQLALLDDPALIEDATAQMSNGVSASSAWQHTIYRQILSYEDAEDEYFRARAGDLRDVAVRVARALGAVEDRPFPLLPGAIVVDDDLSPSSFLALDWSILGGVALERGSAARGHVGRGAWRQPRRGAGQRRRRARRRGGPCWSSVPIRPPARLIARRLDERRLAQAEGPPSSRVRRSPPPASACG